MSKRLKALLLEHNIKQEELAKALGLQRETLSKKLNGKQDWFIGEMVEAKHYLKLHGISATLDELFLPRLEVC